jgi:flagellar protein FliS
MSSELIQMLFDGLIESLATTKGHIQRNSIAEKGKSIARASRIVLGLQGALDFEKGGELATNLNELYNYITRRLLHVNARNDLAALDEIHSLMTEIRGAWESVPALIPRATPTREFIN